MLGRGPRGRIDEIDRDEGVWTIPTSRTLGRGGSRVFPSGCAESLGAKDMSSLLKKSRIAAVPHGFRSSFRDWAAEDTDHPREVAEAALVHKVHRPVEAPYRRTDLFERQRWLMDNSTENVAGERPLLVPREPLPTRDEPEGAV